MRSKLRIENLTKEYEGQLAIDSMSFTVYDGEFLSILGPSGCGKTTLLRVLIGLLPATNGKIIKDGADITTCMPNNRGMGIVFQNLALFENMTVLENVEYAMKINKEKRENSREKSLEMIEELGLTECVHKKPAELSGGQQQRVAIARTLVLTPDIILFDEPMSALDVDTRLVLRKVLKDIQEYHGTTMIYVTHDQEEAFSMSDRILIMEKSRLQQLDTPENIILNPANEYVKSFVIDNLWAKINSLAKFMR